MKTYQSEGEAESQGSPCVYAIGNFDGVHLGHLSLLGRAREMAASLGVAFGVYTFWPHPVTVLNPGSRLQLICTRKQKMNLLAEYGVECVVEQPFDAHFASMPAEQFATEVIARNLGARGVVTGENFRFGNQALGTPEKMEEWLKPFGIECDIIPSVSVGATVCSSSRIRQLVMQGLVAEASTLLGRNYSLTGRIIEGAGRGKGIGIPTANIKSDSALVPAPGVYASWVRLGDDNRLFKSATNIGVRPTFDGDQEIHIETHIIDFTAQIYGQEMEIFFAHKIRAEKKFDSIDALVTQIRVDIEQAKNLDISTQA